MQLLLAVVVLVSKKGHVASARMLRQEQLPGVTNATANATSNATATSGATGAPSLASLPQCQNYTTPSPFYNTAFLGPQLTISAGKLHK